MKRLALLALLAPLCLASPSSAGQRTSGTVGIDLNARRAWANVGHTYNSSNISETIRCEVTAYPTKSVVQCFARNPAGVTAACSYVDPPPAMITAVAAIAADSNVHFTWSTTGQCSYISVHLTSNTDPKLPPYPNQSVMVP